MNAQAPIRKGRKPAPAGRDDAPKARLRPALKDAIDEIVWKGKTQREAAKVAGMNETALARALARPAVAEYVEYLKAQAVLDADKLKAQARAMAIKAGIQLLTDAKSEAVRARMVEFFAGEARGPAFAVQINTAPAMGYQYRKPDNATGADAGQPVEIEGKAHPVVKGD